MVEFPDGNAVPFGDRHVAIAWQRLAFEEICERHYQKLRSLLRPADIIARHFYREPVLNQYLDAMLHEEALAEIGWRSGLVRGYILGKGLGEHTEDIMCGLARSSRRAVDTPRQELIKDFRAYHRTMHDEVLDRNLAYVDRWQMYQQMFDKLERTK